MYLNIPTLPPILRRSLFIHSLLLILLLSFPFTPFLPLAMTMKKQSPNSKSSPTKTPYRYLKPGALAKLRDSKISAKHASRTLSQLMSPSTPISPIQNEQHQLNIDNMIPCFAPTVDFTHRPRSLARKKLFAVTPIFTPHTDTYRF